MAKHLEPDTLALIDSYAETQARIKILTEVADYLKSELIGALGDHEVGIDSAGAVRITYRASRKFDTGKASQLVDAATLAACQKVDGVKLKRILGDAADACMVDGAGPRRFVIPTA